MSPRDGVEPLLAEEFCGVDIDSANPDPDVTDWELRIGGVVENQQRVGSKTIDG